MPLQTSLEVATSNKKTPKARLSEALNELAKQGPAQSGVQGLGKVMTGSLFEWDIGMTRQRQSFGDTLKQPM